MRRPSVLVFFLCALLAAPAASLPVQAGVLLPDDNNSDNNSDSKSFIPNLGLGRFFGLNKDKKGTDSAPPNKPSSLPQTTPNAPSTPTGSVAAPANNNAATNAQAIMSSGSFVSSSFQQGMAQLAAEVKRRNQYPPLILHDNARTQDAETAATLPSSFTILVDRAYYWGQNDLARLSKVYGYTTSDIQSRCIVRLNPKVMTDKGEYANIVYPGQQVTIKYDGTIQLIEMRAMAVCDKPSQLPQSGATLEIVGDKLSTHLPKDPSCMVSGLSGNPATLQTNYAGDGNATCKFN